MAERITQRYCGMSGLILDQRTEQESERYRSWAKPSLDSSCTRCNPSDIWQVNLNLWRFTLEKHMWKSSWRLWTSWLENWIMEIKIEKRLILRDRANTQSTATLVALNSFHMKINQPQAHDRASNYAASHITSSLHCTRLTWSDV